jgi:epoxyqueuosine reductase
MSTPAPSSNASTPTTPAWAGWPRTPACSTPTWAPSSSSASGSFFFLGVLITNLELEIDTPPADGCGACTLCLEACPTGALVEPYLLDARRCISYLTIELRDAIPEELRPGMGRHLFGCDICQDVCPYNQRTPRTEQPAFHPRDDSLFHPRLAWLAALTEDDFRRAFRDSPVKRAKHRGLLRNTLVAMGNSGNAAFRPTLEKFAASKDSLLAEHARWALNQLEGDESRSNKPTEAPRA